jgi:hypothetical protein
MNKKRDKIIMRRGFEEKKGKESIQNMNKLYISQTDTY